MQFCTINEAWGKNEHINYTKNSQSEQSKKSKIMETNMNDSTDSSIIETFIEQKKQKRRPKQQYYTATEDSYYETYTDTINDSRERDKLIQKVLKSRRCRNVLRKKFRPNLINKLLLVFDDYKDVLVLMLVGFCFIIFLNLLYNINSKN
jgi:hypothetical protein